MKEKYSAVFPSGSCRSKFSNPVTLSTQAPDTPLQSDRCPVPFKEEGYESCTLFSPGPYMAQKVCEID